MIDSDSIVISQKTLQLIAELDEFKGAWIYWSHISPDRLSSLKKVATIESIGSSTRIEGARLTNKQIELLLAEVDTKSFDTRDEQEVAGYAFACEKVFTHFSEIPLTENFIKQLHVWLLQFSEKDQRHRGNYKKIPIRIEAFDQYGKSAGIIFETISPLETPLRVTELIKWTNDVFIGKNLHPLLIIALFTVVFLAIHPFQDGNGRLSRLLTTLLMLKEGYHYAVYSSLESIIESNKSAYYKALQKTQIRWLNKEEDPWTPWVLFFLESLQRQKRHLEVKIKNERSLIELSQLAVSILKLIESQGPLKISELEKLTQANRNTLKKH
ncbi:MAG: Fic family protein [Parachlamydia sp.]|nr:Fic family protein [Parachlamydia sp.]